MQPYTLGQLIEQYILYAYILTFFKYKYDKCILMRTKDEIQYIYVYYFFNGVINI